MSNKKRVVVTTGASRGIGEKIFNIFKNNNDISIGLSRNTISDDFFYKCDITNKKNVKSVFSNIFYRYGRIDVLINNAGIVNHKNIESLKLSDWNNIINTNLTGAFLCIKQVLPSMRKNGYGKIVNISSIAGRFRSEHASVAYTSSKYGLIGLTRQLAYKYAKYNVNINAVCPSQTKTNMLINNLTEDEVKKLENRLPSKRLANAQEIAKIVYFLTLNEASYINGASIDVNGAQY